MRVTEICVDDVVVVDVDPDRYHLEEPVYDSNPHVGNPYVGVSVSIDQCEECETTGQNCRVHSLPGSPGRSIYDKDNTAQSDAVATVRVIYAQRRPENCPACGHRSFFRQCKCGAMLW